MTPPEGEQKEQLGDRLPLRCLAAGAALAACVALGSAPLGWHLLQWVVLIPLLWALDGLSWRRSVLVGWAAGFAIYVAVFNWIAGTIGMFGGMPLAVGWLLFLVMASIAGLQGAVLGGLDAAARRAFPRLRWLMLPFLFVGVEWLWPMVFLWGAGSGQAANNLVVQVIDITGPLGLTFLVVLVNASLYAVWAWRRHDGPPPWAALGCTAAILVVVFGYGAWRRADVRVAMAAAPTARVGWVQPNKIRNHVNDVPAEDVWLTLWDGAKEVGRQRPDLIVLPESSTPHALVEAIPAPADASAAVLDGQRELEEEAGYRRERIRRVATLAGCPALVGTMFTRVRAVGADDAWEDVEGRNSMAVCLPKEGIVDRYDKHHLLVFGEYVPGESIFPALNQLMPVAGQTLAGSGPRLLEVGGLRVGPLMCYEATFPGDVRAIFDHGDPELLVNITNDDWFGLLQGPFLHRMVVSLRAVETRRPLLRVTTTGVSALVLPDGTSRDDAPMSTHAVRVSEIPRVNGALQSPQRT